MAKPVWLRRVVPFFPFAAGDRDAGGADVGSREDVTCRHLEQRLRDSEERLRLALTAAKITSWEWRVDTGEVTATGGMGAILGLAAPRTPFALTDGEARIGVSVGIALSPPVPTQPITLLREADAALDEAKAASGDRFVVFAPHLPSVAAHR